MSYHLDTPVLQTDRLTLRAPQPRDAGPFITYYQTDRAQFTGGPMTERQAWNFFGTHLAHWLTHGFGLFAVTRTGDDTPIGMIGHWYPLTWPETEVGWILFDPANEGQGYASEAAQACISHAWTALNWTSCVSYIAPGNAASIALATRLGATHDPEAAAPPSSGTQALVYRHARPA